MYLIDLKKFFYSIIYISLQNVNMCLFCWLFHLNYFVGVLNVCQVLNVAMGAYSRFLFLILLPRLNYVYHLLSISRSLSFTVFSNKDFTYWTYFIIFHFLCLVVPGSATSLSANSHHTRWYKIRFTRRQRNYWETKR